MTYVSVLCVSSISGDIIQLVNITVIDETGSLIAVIAYLWAPPVCEVVINFQHGIFSYIAECRCL